MNTMIVVDSCCDLPLSYIECQEAYIDVIAMPVCIDGEAYLDDLGKTLKHDFLYEQLANGIMPSTAQINTYQFTEIFKKHIKNNMAVIYIGLSVGLSGTHHNAIQAVKMVKAEYPSASIEIMISKSASIGQGILAMKAVDLIKSGHSFQAVFKWLEANELNANHWFAVNDLQHLKNGGRITAAQAAVGTLLNVKPILVVDQKGILKKIAKVKGRKKSIQFLMDKFQKHYDATTYEKVIIGHGHVIEEALQLKARLAQHIDEELIIISELSATIASHVGPGMLAIGFIGGKREI